MAKQYETVIGLEVHIELATKTKIFCGCSTEFGGAPNTHTCPVCTGMPGSLPVLNKQVVEYAMAIGLATNCKITQVCKFDRKNYFYPDNPQNYQISQLYLPIARDGYVEIESGSGKKKVRIHEMHMEEDAGKLVHDEWDDTSLVDYNRSGVPLVEIVSEPDMRSAEEVIAYLEKFSDIKDTKLEKYINLLVKADLIDEYSYENGSKLHPYRGVTRTDAAFFISRILGCSYDYAEAFDYYISKYGHYNHIEQIFESYKETIPDYVHYDIPSYDAYKIQEWSKPYFAYLLDINLSLIHI